jgi:colanic acid biosynthesis protein WcaH
MFLEKDLFSTVIKSTPLVSIDLVVKNNRGQTLLGQRLNKPAKGFWFVPGGAHIER